MTDTPALLPPAPDRPGRYWMKQHWGDNVVARWNPSGRYWNTGEFSVLTAKDAAVLGYTLASPHPIPSAAALERLHKLADDFKREAREGSEGVRADYLLISICTAQADADMLRAALEDRE